MRRATSWSNTFCCAFICCVNVARLSVIIWFVLDFLCRSKSQIAVQFQLLVPVVGRSNFRHQPLRYIQVGVSKVEEAVRFRDRMLFFCCSMLARFSSTIWLTSSSLNNCSLSTSSRIGAQHCKCDKIEKNY